MATTTQQHSIPEGRWRADTVHSSLTFEIEYAVARFAGEVRDFDVTLEDGKLSGSARVASISVKDEDLEGHLLSPEFFDAERYPELTFTSTEAHRDGDSVEFSGEVTMKGITRPVTLTGSITGPTVDHFGATRLGLALETTIDRTDFDMNWNMPLPTGQPALANEVTLRANLTLVQQ
jgi:polyisoprenoid-binding protein YceI